MKRLFALVLAAALLLCGCGGADKGGDQKKSDNHTENIRIGDTTLTIGKGLTNQQKADLGTPVSTSEAPSCLYEGYDMVYEYEGFSLQTNQQDEKEILCIVTLKSDAYPTDKGVKVGDTAAAVTDAYGKADETTKYYVVYHLSKTVVLTFYLEAGAVTSIEYAQAA